VGAVLCANGAQQRLSRLDGHGGVLEAQLRAARVALDAIPALDTSIVALVTTSAAAAQALNGERVPAGLGALLAELHARTARSVTFAAVARRLALVPELQVAEQLAQEALGVRR
jgi:hypothetical protein